MEVLKLKPQVDTQKILEDERSRASFNVMELQEFLNGGKDRIEQRKKWQELFDTPLFDQSNDDFLSRQEYFKKCVERSFATYDIIKKNKDLLSAHSPMHGGGHQAITTLSNNSSGMSDHFMFFVTTVLTQGTPEQQKEWLPKAIQLEILGSYVQTELGHGSNVRGLETTAMFDSSSDEFIINSPTLTSLKWWPGGLGVLATHAIVYARLIIKDVDYGYHAFVVPIRDGEHKAKPGVVVGDIGPKMAYNNNDSGFVGFSNVRIPRFNLLARFQQVTPSGEYVKPQRGLSKIGYITMTRTRCALVRSAFNLLAKGCTITVRYNAVRLQGFKNTKAANVAESIRGGEFQILDYVVQQQRIFGQLSTAFAMWFVSSELHALLSKFDAAIKSGDNEKIESATQILPELHATSAGLKAFCTDMAQTGLDELRKCCGGQGFTLSGGLAQLMGDAMPGVTAEGDKIIMALQTSRYLVQQYENIVNKTFTIAKLPAAVHYLTKRPKLINLKGKGWTVEKVIEAFENVTRLLAEQSYDSIQSHLKKGKSYEESWNLSHILLYRLSYNHIVLTMLKSFHRGLERLKNSPASYKVMQAVLRCYAYTEMQKGFVTEWSAVVSTTDSRLVVNELNKALADMRPDAVALVDAFGFSDKALHSCIGRYDGKVYESLVDWATRSSLNDDHYQETIYKEVLSKYLNKQYLAKL